MVGLAAVCFVVFIASRGMQGNSDVEKFLASAGIAEQLRGSISAKMSDSGQDSPLIRQAKAFALRIDPPPAKAAAAPQERPRNPVLPPRPKVKKVATDFTLLGTSSHLEDETESLALINEVGKGLRWVKQGQRVGRLLIESIGSGAILINDGGNTYELAVQRVQKPDYVKSYSGKLPEQTQPKSWQSGAANDTLSAVVPMQMRAAEKTALVPSPNSIKENIEWLKKLQTDPAVVGGPGGNANGLLGLGDMLKSLEKDLEKAKKLKNEPNESNKTDSEKLQPLPKTNKSDANINADMRKKAIEALMQKRRRRGR